MQRSADDPEIGLSWFLEGYRGHRTAEQGGGDTGYVSFILMIPEQSIGVVAMANYDRTPIHPKVDAALEVLLGLDPEWGKRAR